ncbi:MAG: thioredoxin domain-containing protein [Patescibacteria group bacterium]
MNEFAQGGISPKRAFIGGIVIGILILCAIGFFILLGVVLKSGGSPSAAPLAFGNDPSAGAPSAGGPPAPPAGPLKEVAKDEHIRGPKDAKVTIVEYSDFECPFCKNFHETMVEVLASNKDVRWVYRHFPLSFHPTAQPTAEASECVADLGGNDAFWKFADAAFGKGGAHSTADIENYARTAGVDAGKFKKCVESGKYKSKVNQQQQEGQSAGVQGTPGNFVVGPNGTRELPGAVPASSVQAAIDGVK